MTPSILPMNADDFHIRPMQPHEVALAVDWAAAEGWNPGLADAACFAAVDPAGFLVGEHQGRPAATISVVNYDDTFAFLGFYIVRPDLRGRGFGLRLWQAGIAHAGARTIGLDGVVAQQGNYRKSGFALAYNNVRYGGVPAGLAHVPAKWTPVRRQEHAPMQESAAATVPLAEVPFDLIARDDAGVFPAGRAAFLRSWIAAPGHVGRAIIHDGTLMAWGVIRPCRRGRKIGPLVASSRAAAETILAALIGDDRSEVFLDVPQVNGEAVALARAAGLSPVFETARMYAGPIRPVAAARIFGVTTFELG